jgi:integrase
VQGDRDQPSISTPVPHGAEVGNAFLSTKEVQRLAEEIQRHLGTPRYRRYGAVLDYGLLVQFAFLTGLRAGEIEALTVRRLESRCQQGGRGREPR